MQNFAGEAALLFTKFSTCTNDISFGGIGFSGINYGLYGYIGIEYILPCYSGASAI